MDIDRRNGIKRALLGAGVGAVALAGINRVAAETIVTDEYVSVDGKRFTDAATVVVGPSGNVDFLVSDYASADVAIQAAIDYVNGLGGGAVHLREGEYSIENTPTLVSNLSLSGCGNSTIIKAASGFSDNTLVAGNGISNLSISDIKFDGDHQDIGSCIKIETSSIISFHNVTAINAGSSDIKTPIGIAFGLCDNVIISDCTMMSNFHYGISIYKCQQVCVTGCRSISNGRHGYGVGGAVQADSEDVTFAACVASNNGLNGFWCRTVDRLVIDGCICDTNTVYAGISLEDVRDSCISSNSIINCGQHGILLRNNVGVCGNISLNNNVIKNTKLVQTSGNGISIEALGSSGYTISGNVIDNCYSGISLNQISFFSIVCNKIENTDRDGISIWRSYDGAISGNVVRNCGTDLISGQQSGIVLNGDVTQNCIQIVVIGNRCYDSQATKTQLYGITEKGSSDYNLIGSNVLRGNGTSGFTNVGSNTITVDNIV